MQFGGTLKRILRTILSAPPQHGPVYLLKIDLSDGFYRVPLAPADVPRLGVVLPRGKDATDDLIAFPVTLPMGWTESPPQFTAFTETIANLANQLTVTSSWDPPPHPMEQLASSTPPPPPPVPTTNASPLPSHPRHPKTQWFASPQNSSATSSPRTHLRHGLNISLTVVDPLPTPTSIWMTPSKSHKAPALVSIAFVAPLCTAPMPSSARMTTKTTPVIADNPFQQKNSRGATAVGLLSRQSSAGILTPGDKP